MIRSEQRRRSQSEGLQMNVEEVQRRLWERSQAQRAHREASMPLFPTNPYEGRIRNLFDLMHHREWLGTAMARVLERSRGKAPGVDGVTVHQFAEHLPDEFERLRQELKSGTYVPRPLRRVEIPKPNGKVRPLGIPCLRDKIVQEAVRMALEPIFEVEFHEGSYGFRPNRNPHHAIFRCQHLMRSGFTWVIEGDVKACFDEISHEAILRCVREKVMDNKFLDLIRRFLKGGVVIEGVLHPTVKGVPQGGVVSPLLANAVLNKLDWFLHSKGHYGSATTAARDHRSCNLRFVRYADDWCVFLTRTNRRRAEQLREDIRNFLAAQCGLRLSEEKTYITHVRDGFDFLGFHLEVSTGRRGDPVPKIKVGQKAIRNIRTRMDEAMRYRPAQESIASRIQRTSLVIRGWANYYKIAHNYSRVSSHLDCHAFHSTLRTICRKYDISARTCLRRYWHGTALGLHTACTLARFRDAWEFCLNAAPEPYQPSRATHPTDGELEATLRCRENVKSRPGSQDLRWQALVRDNFECQRCHKQAAANGVHADHRQPVRRFASFAQASTLANLQTLCPECHRAKTREDQGA
jgi:RNA-directed DNA polymerase